MTTFRQLSRQEWTGENTRENINAGSLQRIADATEKVAANYDAVVADRDRYKRWYESEQRQRKAEVCRCNALRGVITRMKRKVVNP